MVSNQIRPPQQNTAPFRGLHVSPLTLERIARRFDGRVDIAGIAFGHPRNDGFGGGIDGFEVASRLRRTAHAVNQ